MKLFNLFIGLVIVLILGGFLFYKDGFHQDTTTPTGSEELAELRMDIANYVPYSELSLKAAQERGSPVLFFAATTWCQSCSALEDEILERHGEIPAEMIILKVDYDNDKAMNAKYGVTAQHTLIVLDQGGKEVNRWIGGGFDTLLQQAAQT